MPSKPMPIELEEILKIRPTERPDDLPDGVWEFPARLAAIAQARELSREEVAELAHVTAGTITRWFQWQGLGGLKAPAICWLEIELGLSPGTLLGTPKAGKTGGNTFDVVAVIDMAMRLGLDKSVIAE